MNKIRNDNYSRSPAFILLALSIALSVFILAGCLGSAPTVPAADGTLPPAPVATRTAESLLPAYPSPGEPYPDAITDSAGNAATAYPGPGTPGGFAPGADPIEITEEIDPTSTSEVYFPVIGREDSALPTATPTVTTPTMAPPTAIPSPTLGPAAVAQPTPINVVDFAAARDTLAAKGQQLAYNKIGFHVTFLEDRQELDPYMQRLDDEGVPFFLKSVDNAEPVYKAQELMKVSGVPHTLVYRSTMYDVPNYDMDPILAAETYWELEKAIWPPELDPSLVWLETMNELDKNRSEWLAQFSLRTAELALRDGYKWAAFGWSSGEPEPEQWESPAMLELLRLIGENPDQLAIALHEYSYVAENIGHEYPHKIGRFLDLFAVADKHGIPRPTVLITEWGWAYDNIPPEPNAMEDITWAARLYGAYPQVLGAAIWNLGRLDGQITPLNEQVQGLIDNMLALSLDTYLSAPALPQLAPLDAGQFPPP